MTTHSSLGRNGVPLNKMKNLELCRLRNMGLSCARPASGPAPSHPSRLKRTARPVGDSFQKCCLTHSENDAEIGAAATERESSGRVWRQQKIRTDGGARDATGRRVRADRRVAVRGLRSAETGGPDVPARHGYKPLGGDGRKRVASALLLRVTAFSTPPVRPGDPGVQCRPG